MQLHPPVTLQAAKRKLDKILSHQYLRKLLCYEITCGGQGPICIRLERLAGASAAGLTLFRTSHADYGSRRVEHGAGHPSLSWRIESGGRVSRFERSPHALHSTAIPLDRPETARSRFYLYDGLSAGHAAAPALAFMPWETPARNAGHQRSPQDAAKLTPQSTTRSW